MADRDPPPPTADLIPPPAVIRSRLAASLRDVDILKGLLRLSEAVARRDGQPVAPTARRAGGSSRA